MDDGNKPECEINYDTWLAIGNALATQISNCDAIIEECEILLSELCNTYECIRKMNYPEKHKDLAAIQANITNITKKMM